MPPSMASKATSEPRSLFGRTLAQLQPHPAARRWVFVPYDQLNDQMGPLARAAPTELGIICIETSWKPRLRRYHQQKLALIVANQRHFALEQAKRGVAVRYVASDQSYGEVLAGLRRELGTIECMEPAERELRQDIAGVVQLVPHEGWLTSAADFAQLGEPPWRMDAFYRCVRKKTGWLMDAGKPRGGRYSFDSENRLPYRGSPPLPSLPTFRPDAITCEVGEMIARRYGDHPGKLDLRTLPATKADAQRLWRWAQKRCLPHFGPYEDAMTLHSTNLFHTRLSPVLNLYRLLPVQIIEDALLLDIALPSLEGFVRQILGWREFMHHVHVHSDGLRTFKDHNVLQAHEPVFAAYWGKPSGMHCLDTVVQSVWQEGYSHHITRLMILCNLGTLLGINPRALTDWFWVAYIDAYDWVMDTNGMGMGLYALGEAMTTKPYISGAAYINRMSDYCKACAFNPKKDCPITNMYWAFLAKHQRRLEGNFRMGKMYMGLARRPPWQREEDRRITAEVVQRLR
ncbi:MAG: deoxyribodipyrimidine photolyase, partial [Deltaproteobacteria bacterium]